MNRENRSIGEFIQQMPKVELHVHLEGTVTPKFWLKLLNKHGQNGEKQTLESLRKRYEYQSFMDFIYAYRDVLAAFQDPSDLYDLTKQFLKKSANENIRYCEVMLTPWFLTRKGLDFHEIMQEIDRAAREAEKEHGIEMKLIFDGPRNFGKEVVRSVFEQAVNDRTGRVIGVGLGGAEAEYPAKDYVEEFDFARSAGLKTICHAGETDGKQSMIDSINLLKVSRMGHCLGIPKSSELEELILKKGVTLDLCPWSNVATRVIPGIESHPFPEYLKRDYPISINTDDPGFFQTDIIKEFTTMQKLYQLSREQLVEISKKAVTGSFLSNEKKAALNQEIDLSISQFPGGS